MRVDVLTAEHGLGDETLTGGSHDVVVTPDNAPLLAGAAAAGVLTVVEASPDEEALLHGHVQTQEDGEAEYALAVEEGRWAEGQAVQAEIDRAALEDAIEIGSGDVAAIEGES